MPVYLSLKPGRLTDQISDTTIVKALSWNQPYAGLMLYGKQETRRKLTHVRGLVLICSCQKPYDLKTIASISGGLQYDRLTETLGMSGDGLVTSQAIGIGYLTGCHQMRKEDEDACFVEYNPGLWVWEFSDVKRIEPFDWKGKQGWKDVDVETKRRIIIS